jgi:REP element-mobilizing transposase RayT
MAIAFFSTWTMYGTWLPGDDRGWFERDNGYRLPDQARKWRAALLMTEDAVTLDDDQRHLVERTIADHSRLRDWPLYAVNCRTNHVHVVVTAPNRPIEAPREQFKAWCTRKLNEFARHSPLAGRASDEMPLRRRKWWTDRGWDVFLDNEDAVWEAVQYVREGQ